MQAARVVEQHLVGADLDQGGRQASQFGEERRHRGIGGRAIPAIAVGILGKTGAGQHDLLARARRHALARQGQIAPGTGDRDCNGCRRLPVA
jgi:hypothetical protein